MIWMHEGEVINNYYSQVLTAISGRRGDGDEGKQGEECSDLKKKSFSNVQIRKEKNFFATAQRNQQLFICRYFQSQMHSSSYQRRTTHFAYLIVFHVNERHIDINE